MNYVIVGPPGSGKSHYVAEHTQRGDLVVDVDTLFQALSGRQIYDKPTGLLSYVLAARDAVIAKIESSPPTNAYVITSSGKRADVHALRDRLGAELIVMDADSETCKERIANDARRDDGTDWNALIDEWWSDWQAEQERGAGMAEMEMRAWQDCRLEIREATDGGPSRIVGRAVPYGELSVDLGGFREIIIAGAIDIADKDIRSLWQHDSSMVLGRTTVGTMALTMDERGIYPDITPPDTQWARDAMVSLKRGDVSGFSFGFVVDEDNWVVTGREIVRQVLHAQLLEVSPVTFPAYPTTSAQVRSQVAALQAQVAPDTDPAHKAEQLAAEALRAQTDLTRAWFTWNTETVEVYR